MNAPPSPHPAVEQLQAYCRGRLAEKEIVAIQAHLERCPGCMAKVSMATEGGQPTTAHGAQENSPPMSTHATIGSVLAAPTATAAWQLPPQASAATGPHLPGLEILKVLGRGGMGVVYLVRQTALKRLAALKVLRKGDDAGVNDLARFRIEAETIARLQHDNIVQIYQVGADGEAPYLLLEYVEGGTLAQKLAAAPLASRQAAAIALTLAQAIQFAHERGVIHRDLKPANILLNPFGKPKINDFGLAKQVDFQNITGTEAILGTPSYMAPEQAAGRSRDITPLADVYSLGAILYEMVVGRPPFKGESPLVTIRQVLGQEPAPPRRLQPEVPADLEAIILKCLEKDPGRRYESAMALAEDLRRYLANEPVQARPATWWARSAKWVRRRPAIAGLIGVSFVALLFLCFALAGWLYSGRLESALAEVEKQKASADRQRDHAEDQKARASYMAGLFAAQQSRELGTASFIFDFLERTRPASGKKDFRGFEWYHLWRLCHREEETLRDHKAPVKCIALSADDATLATASRDGVILLWDFAKRKKRHALPRHDDVVTNLAFAPDGKTLASASLDGAVKLWNVDSGQEIAKLTGHEGGASTCLFDPQGKWLVTGSRKGTLRLWPVGDSRIAPRILARLLSQVTCVAVSPSGDFLAANGGDQLIQIWKMPSGKELAPLKGHKNVVHSLAFSPDGGGFASGSEDGELLLWDLTNEAVDKKFNLHRGPVSSLTFNPSGNVLVSGSLDHSVRIWRSGPKGWLFDSVALGHTGKVSGAVLSADGRYLITGSYDRTVKIWDLDPVQEPRTLRGHQAEVKAIVFGSDGVMYSVGADNILRQRQRDEDNLRGLKVDFLVAPTCMVLRPSDNKIFLGGAQGTLFNTPGEIRILEPGRWLHDPLAEQESWVLALALSPDGRVLASGGRDGEIGLWNSFSREKLATLVGGADRVRTIAFSHDGATLASGAANGRLVLWDVKSRRQRMTLAGYEGTVNCLAFSPDGQFLVLGGENKTTHQCPLVVWDLAANKQHALLKGHTNMVNALAFSPDGKQLATGSHDQTVKLWDWEAGEERATYKDHLSPIKAIAFSPDGRTLVSGDQDGNLVIRRGASDAEVSGAR